MNRVRGGRGYLLIDNTVSGGAKVEMPTLTCCHCNTVVVLNSARVRPRNYCRKCNAYLCDSKICNEECNPFLLSLELAVKYPLLEEPFLLRGYNGEVLYNKEKYK